MNAAEKITFENHSSSSLSDWERVINENKGYLDMLTNGSAKWDTLEEIVANARYGELQKQVRSSEVITLPVVHGNQWHPINQVWADSQILDFPLKWDVNRNLSENWNRYNSQNPGVCEEELLGQLHEDFRECLWELYRDSNDNHFTDGVYNFFYEQIDDLFFRAYFNHKITDTEGLSEFLKKLISDEIAKRRRD